VWRERSALPCGGEIYRNILLVFSTKQQHFYTAYDTILIEAKQAAKYDVCWENGH